MSIVTLKQIAKLPTGVFGEIEFGGFTFLTCEGYGNCLEAGEYEIVEKGGHLRVGDMPIHAERNTGQSRMPGLALGLHYDRNAWDVTDKRTCLARLIEYIKGEKLRAEQEDEECKIVLKVESAEASNSSLQGVVRELDEALAETKAELAKVTSIAEAQAERIDELEAEAEADAEKVEDALDDLKEVLNGDSE